MTRASSLSHYRYLFWSSVACNGAIVCQHVLLQMNPNIAGFIICQTSWGKRLFACCFQMNPKIDVYSACLCKWARASGWVPELHLCYMAWVYMDLCGRVWVYMDLFRFLWIYMFDLCNALIWSWKVRDSYFPKFVYVVGFQLVLLCIPKGIPMYPHVSPSVPKYSSVYPGILMYSYTFLSTPSYTD